MSGKVFCTSLHTGSSSAMVLRSVQLLCQWQDHHNLLMPRDSFPSEGCQLWDGRSATARRVTAEHGANSSRVCSEHSEHSTDVTQLPTGAWLPPLGSSQVGLSTRGQNLGTGTSVSSHSRHSHKFCKATTLLQFICTVDTYPALLTQCDTRNYFVKINITEKLLSEAYKK